MYEVYLDGKQLPITPSKLDIKIGNRNKTLTLINDGEINLLKEQGLTEVAFDVLLPHKKYPFAASSGSISSWLDRFETWKSQRKRFRFIVTREDLSFDTNLNVCLEEYSVKEDASSYGQDVVVSVKLKEYKPFGTKTAVIQETTNSTTTPSTQREAKDPPKTYTVQPNDGFWLIAKKTLNDGSRMYDVASYNGMTINSMIHPGDKLRIPPK